MSRPRSPLAAAVLSLVLASCTNPAADGAESFGEDSGAESDPADEGTGGPPVCGDGMVQGEEQCDTGDACDERCRIPGTVQWTEDVESTVRDLAFAPQGLLVCSEGLALLDPDERSTIPLDGPPGERCERVAVAPDGSFAALAWPEGGFAERVGVAAYDPDGTTRWEVPSLGLLEQIFSRPALALASDGRVVVAGSRKPDFFSTLHVVEFDASGAQAWSHTYAGATASEASSVAIAPNGQVVVGGKQHPPDSGGAVVLLVLDEGESLYNAAEDFTQDEIDTAADLVLTDDGTIVIAGTRDTVPYVAAFAPPSREVLWSRDLTDVRSAREPALARHPSGYVAVAAHAEDWWSVELLDSNGDAVWMLTEDSEGGGDASLAIDDGGDLYVSFGRDISRIAAPAVSGR